MSMPYTAGVRVEGSIVITWMHVPQFGKQISRPGVIKIDSCKKFKWWHEISSDVAALSTCCFTVIVVCHELHGTFWL